MLTSRWLNATIIRQDFRAAIMIVLHEVSVDNLGINVKISVLFWEIEGLKISEMKIIKLKDTTIKINCNIHKNCKGSTEE